MKKNHNQIPLTHILSVSVRAASFSNTPKGFEPKKFPVVYGDKANLNSSRVTESMKDAVNKAYDDAYAYAANQADKCMCSTTAISVTENRMKSSVAIRRKTKKDDQINRFIGASKN